MPIPFVHTLNGTAAAVPRLVIALLENGVVLDSKKEIRGIVGLELPKVLRPFWLATGHQSKVDIRWT